MTEQAYKFQQILTHPLFLDELKNISKKETNRKFCKHTIEHFLDVCRLMLLHSLEQQLPFSQDILYACGLLHDIGRAYEEHHLKSAQIAHTILTDCHYTKEEILLITTAISAHRTNDCPDKLAQPLTELLYTCDKTSRLCFLCKAQEACYWQKEKRNTTIHY